MLIRRKVRRASRAVMTTVTVITTAQTAITERRKSAREDSSAIHILSVARLSPRWDPWRCVPGLLRVCRFENVKSRKQTYLKQLKTTIPEALSARQGIGGLFFWRWLALSDKLRTYFEARGLSSSTKTSG